MEVKVLGATLEWDVPLTLDAHLRPWTEKIDLSPPSFPQGKAISSLCGHKSIEIFEN